MSAAAQVVCIGRGRLSGEAARLRLVECRAILGGEYEPLRDVWDYQATAKDRRLLLAMAGHAASMAGHLSKRAWCDLLPETRVAIAGALRRWSVWAGRLK